MLRKIVFSLAFSLMILSQPTFSFKHSVCDTNTAYEIGIIDAKLNRAQQTDFGVNCAVYRRNIVNKAYNEGYAAGLNGGSLSKRQCLIAASGAKVCGYHCMRAEFGNIICARYPSQQCMKNQFGAVKCGYNCAKNSSGDVKCGKTYLDNCVFDSYGEIKCGENCRNTQEGIKCGIQ